MVLNVSDLWPLSAVELGAMKEGGVYHGVMGRIERFLYRKATACQGQSKEIVDYIKRYEPGKASFLLLEFAASFCFTESNPFFSKAFQDRLCRFAGRGAEYIGVDRVCRF